MRTDEVSRDGSAQAVSSERRLLAAPGARDLLPRFVRAEANLLRLPLFALHTKGLKTLDGIECRGTTTRDGQTHEYVFRATRNTATLYPGPLARAAHLALLSIATERGLPLENPIPWKWRDLTRRIGIAPSGRTVLHLKAALQSTALLGIHSEYAVYAKPEGRLLRTQEEALHLYERVAFVGSPLPDGGVADANYLWLADWYLQNLNALFTAPIEYDLWRSLDAKSSIASRLYEFLLLNFYSGAPVLRINYENLVPLLPVRPEQYRSEAMRQLGPALTLLTAAAVLRRAEWAESKHGIGQLHLYRGDRVSPPAHPPHAALGFTEEECAGAVQVTELRNLKSPEWSLVADFYRLWSGQANARPTAKELAQARDLLAAHGPAKAKALIPLVVKRMRQKWPGAKTFGAVARYLPEVTREYDREQQARERLQAEEEQLRKERQAQERTHEDNRRFVAQWTPVWDSLPASEQEAIRAAVAASNRYLPRDGSFFHRLCLKELAARRGRASVPAS